MHRKLHTLAVTCVVAAAACSAQPPATAVPTSTAAGAASPIVTPGATPTPAPATAPAPLSATFEPAASAPPGAIPVELGTCCAFKFVPSTLTVEAGTVALFLTSPTNPDRPYDHDIVIGPELGRSLAASPVLAHGESGVWTVENLSPGSYIYWCSVNLHYTQGMQGALTVTP